MKTWYFYAIGFGALMLFDTVTQVSFKLASMHAGEFAVSLEWLYNIFFNPWIYGSVIGYFGALITWMILLKHAPVGPAFAASHLEVVSVLIISVLYFDEHLTQGQIIGAILILAGVAFLASSKEPPH